LFIFPQEITTILEKKMHSPRIALLLLVGSTLLPAAHGVEEVIDFVTDFAATVFGAAVNFRYGEMLPEVTLEYSFTGAKKPINDSSASFTFDILAPGCTGPARDSAVFFNTAIETEPNKLIASILINLSTIAASPTFWSLESVVEDKTDALLQFCVKWNLYYKGTYVNFQETDFVANVTLTQDGLEVGAMTGLDRAVATRMDRYSKNIDFPSRVFFCNNGGLEIEPPTVINQGTPIDICVDVLEQENGPEVFVIGVEQMSYSAKLADGEVSISLLQGGKTISSTNIDCHSTIGGCHIEFTADDRLFLNSQDSENTLTLSGLSVIAFSGDLLSGDEDNRRLSTMRSIQQNDNNNDVDGTIQVSDFALKIQHLNASASVSGAGSSTSSTSKTTTTMSCIAVVFSFALGAVAAFTY
jgi:hypothetical protein